MTAKLAFITAAALCTMLSSLGQAALKTELVEYKEGETVLEGYLAYDDALQGSRPAVLVVHDWMGVADYSKMRTEQLAGEGYVAFCADVYGKGVRPADAKEASALAGKYKADRALLRKRVTAGLGILKGHKLVKQDAIAAIGYCFGGTSVLELARSGAEVAGVISIHGGLDSPSPEDGKNIKCKVLALHGADDPFVKAPDLQAFQEEMRASKVDWQLVSYGGAVHSFTQKKAGNDNSKGAAYNEKADRRSWEAMKQFFAESLPK